MQKKFLGILTIASAIALPALTFAYADAFTILATIALWIKSAIPVLVAAAVMFLIFNIIVYVVSGDAEKKEQAKGYLLWTFIALAFFVMLWGLIKVVSSTFGIQTGQSGATLIPTVY